MESKFSHCHIVLDLELSVTEMFTKLSKPATQHIMI